MQQTITHEGLTFNDLPEAMSTVLRKVEHMEQTISGLREDLKKSQSSLKTTKHVPMSTDEACEFLNIPKTTMYFYARNGKIPCVKKGKKFMFFIDELLEWVESGRKTTKPLSVDEINNILKKKTRSKK